MAQQPPEKKFDLSSLPRGAIGIKGLPISRNTRLPSIRTPRDLTLGAPPKRTFLPNIPPRRDKKPLTSDNVVPQQESATKLEKKDLSQNDRGRGRGRGKAQIIQTTGCIFEGGIASDTLSRKEKRREAYHKSDHSTSSKNVLIKKEKEDKEMAGVQKRIDDLFRDDFIDDDDDDEFFLKPTIFPPAAKVKEEFKPCDAESTENIADVVKHDVNFNQDIAKEMGFDVNRVAEFIKKEKGTEEDGKVQPVIETDVPSHPVIKMFNEENPQMVVLKLPQYFTLPQKMDDSQSETHHKGQPSAESKASNKQKTTPLSISSLPEGHAGKLQVLKSGKVRLLIGGISYDLTSVTSLESKHEVVSIRTSSDTGDLAVLGVAEQKLEFSPNLDNLPGLNSLLS